ncbi:DNA polymerase beta [Merluccius polli]|uniref:DNA polymerase beta n=1 Tax=Merluccius polli TaxID=89951 RepID=A0AA47P128_MERPO|nr:DNA polymerase beta [Merluccius polli]
MEAPEGLEIYVPKDALVGSVNLWTIPACVLRQMGLPRPPTRSSSSTPPSPSTSPKGTLISPVLVRKRTRSAAPGTLWSMRKELAAAEKSSPLQIPFVTSNKTAFGVLRDVTSSRGRRSSCRVPRTSPPPRMDQDSVVVYKGRVYLSMKKPKRRRGGGGDPPGDPTGDPPGDPAGDPPGDPAGDLAPRAPSPTGSSASEGRPWSSPEPHPANSPPTSPGELQVPEDPAGLHEDGEEEPQEVTSTGSSTPDMENTGAASSDQPGEEDHAGRSVLMPTLKHYEDFDFEELAQDEMIARMRAKVIESEAALKSLSS